MVSVFSWEWDALGTRVARSEQRVAHFPHLSLHGFFILLIDTWFDRIGQPKHPVSPKNNVRILNLNLGSRFEQWHGATGRYCIHVAELDTTCSYSTTIASKNIRFSTKKRVWQERGNFQCKNFKIQKKNHYYCNPLPHHSEKKNDVSGSAFASGSLGHMCQSLRVATHTNKLHQVRVVEAHHHLPS